MSYGYLVHAMRKSLTLEVFGVERTIPIEDGSGLIGFLPVYDTKENADSYSEGVVDVVKIKLGDTITRDIPGEK